MWANNFKSIIRILFKFLTLLFILICKIRICNYKRKISIFTWWHFLNVFKIPQRSSEILRQVLLWVIFTLATVSAQNACVLLNPDSHWNTTHINSTDITEYSSYKHSNSRSLCFWQTADAIDYLLETNNYFL